MYSQQHPKNILFYLFFLAQASNTPFYIGLHDEFGNGTYIWDQISGTLTLNQTVYTNWYGNQWPPLEANKRCVTDASNIGWTVADCTVPQFYACERKAGGSVTQTPAVTTTTTKAVVTTQTQGVATTTQAGPTQTVGTSSTTTTSIFFTLNVDVVFLLDISTDMTQSQYNDLVRRFAALHHLQSY